jgi:hypothetical protein
MEGTMSRVPRRTLLKGAAIVGAASQIPGVAQAQPPPAARTFPPSAYVPETPVLDDGVPLRWLEDGPPRAMLGTTWGVPWPRGVLAPDRALRLTTGDGDPVPMQSWATGFWPDGSIKWTAHAIGPEAAPAAAYLLGPGEPATPTSPLRVIEDRHTVDVDTGVIRCRIAKRVQVLMPSIARGERPVATDGTLVCLRKNRPGDAETGAVRQERFTGEIQKVTVEQRGPVRAVVRVDGRHRADRGRRGCLPFTVRLYLYAGSDGSDGSRMVHTFVFDGDQQKDFISGLGIRFRVAMTDQLYDRHIRFAGEGDGQLREAVKGITGLRRDPVRRYARRRSTASDCQIHPHGTSG